MFKRREVAIVEPKDVVPIETVKERASKLNMSICIPSVSHSFSICVEFVKTWFKNSMEEYKKNYFKSVFISGANIMKDFSTRDENDLLKIQKPALAITTDLDPTFDRDGIDQNPLGTRMHVNRSRFEDSFFRDKTKKTYISCDIELLLVKFTFSIKVSSKLQAIDLSRFIRQKFFCGATKTIYCDVDFQVPDALMLRVAQDGGFEIANGKVVDMNGFIQYLNSHSSIPFMYKFRGAKGHFEYFIKLPEVPIHIKDEEVQMDNGERENQLDNNYIVTFDSEVRFPCPQNYSYYSLYEHENIKITEHDGTYNIYDFCMCKIPVVNSKGWNQFIEWDNLEFDDVFAKGEVSTIQIDDVLAQINQGQFKKIIDDMCSSYLNPAIFIEIKLFNDNKEIDLDIDWKAYTLKTKTVLTSKTSHIVLYIDLRYYNEYVSTAKEYSKNRIQAAEYVAPNYAK